MVRRGRRAGRDPFELRRIKRQRLRELKREWDPTNVFRLNHNIEPEDG